MHRKISKDAHVFKGRLIFAANTICAFWIGIVGCFAIVAFFLWYGLQGAQKFQSNGILVVILLATAIVGILALIPGRVLAMWPYAVALEPQKGIWIYTPPTKLWIPLDEIVDIGVYSGVYGGGHVIQLSQSHGIVKQIYINSFFFPDERLAHELRVSIDRRDGVVYTS